MNNITLKQKIGLIFLGLFISLLMLEIIMLIAGTILSFPQWYYNAQLFRSKNEIVILCIGESTTARGGKDAWPVQLQDILNGRKSGVKFKVINAGREGVETDFIAANLTENLEKFKPDIVIAMVGVNDELGTVSYEDALHQRFFLFVKNLRVYKLFRWMCTALTHKFFRNGFAWEARSSEDFVHPKNICDYNNLGEVLRTRGRNKEAEKVFMKAIELDSKNGSAYVGLGEIYIKQELYDEAELMFKKAVTINSNDYGAISQLGICYIKKGKIAEGESNILKSISIAPDFYVGYARLGNLYIDLGRYKDAEEVLKKAIEIKPEYEPAYTALASCYALQGNLDDSGYLVQRIVSSGVRNDRLYGLVATNYELKGDLKKANEYYLKAEQFRMKYYNPATLYNYQKIYDLLTKRNIRLMCMQYPMRSIEPLKKLFAENHNIVYIENKQSFVSALRQGFYMDYFTDTFGGGFGHCTRKGNRLIAENAATAVIKLLK